MLQTRKNFGQIDELDLLKQQINLIKKSTQINLIQKLKFNNYADKMLKHLVVSQQFDFQVIAGILKNAFRYDGIEFTQKTCRQRWYEMHRDRDKEFEIKEQVKQNKRLQSIMAMTNPYSLYNTEELIQNLQKYQMQEIQNPSTFTFDLLPQIPNNGYNIFKDKFRRITDFDQYNKRRNQMQLALKDAQKKDEDKIWDKPMLYTANYKSPNFQVFEQQFTQEKINEIMSNKIELQRLQRQFERQIQISQNRYKSKIKQDVQNQKKKQQYQIEQNWDQYESD